MVFALAWNLFGWCGLSVEKREELVDFLTLFTGGVTPVGKRRDARCCAVEIGFLLW